MILSPKKYFFKVTINNLRDLKSEVNALAARQEEQADNIKALLKRLLILDDHEAALGDLRLSIKDLLALKMNLKVRIYHIRCNIMVSILMTFFNCRSCLSARTAWRAILTLPRTA